LTPIDEIAQRKRHDEDLAKRVVSLICSKDIRNGTMSASVDAGRMEQRILSALELARQDERALMAPNTIAALNEATRTIEKYRNGV
jgi:hypothetical protein